MTTQLVFNSQQQFEELISKQDYELATMFVEAMLKNIFTTESSVPIIEAYFEEEDTIYDFNIERKNFIKNFIKNMMQQAM